MAASIRVDTIALILPFRRSMRAAAAWTNSRGWTSPSATISARPTASNCSYSGNGSTQAIYVEAFPRCEPEELEVGFVEFAVAYP